MATVWTEEKLQHYLDDEVQENLNLDYKGAAALAKTDGKKGEIRKDVSAMANSAGGVLIYGIREYDDAERRHLPERFDPVNQSIFSREWLEQVISGIQPRIQNLVITPVAIGSNLTDTVFVIEIPASNTAHQSSDWRYYKRYNFESVAMNDYEVRDVMNRSTHALIDIEFKLEFERRVVHKTDGITGAVIETSEKRFAQLSVYARNPGTLYAQYIVAYLYMPVKLAYEADHEKSEDGRAKIRIDNTKSDYVGARSVHTRNVPVLPGVRENIGTTNLFWPYAINEHEDAEIEWEVFADDAPVRRGLVQLSALRANANRYETVKERGPFDFDD